MKICAIIPTYNHYKKLPDIVTRLREQNLPVFIVDDGSTEPARTHIAGLQNETQQITLCRLTHNQGKGAAVMAGFHLALAAGFTHAVQVDADGQHDLSALPQLLKLAAENSRALISGQPVYDKTVPLGRKIGRWATHIWVWIETLSFRITDSMCGFRVYPLQPTRDIMADHAIGQRMEFDTEIMVRLFWRGIDVIMLPVRVIYPPDNTSNFHVWRDNWRITKMHARFFFGMLAWRFIPRTKTDHWAHLAERGSYAGLVFCAAAYRLLGRTACRLILLPIVFYFFLFGKKQRNASQEFLTRVLKRKPTLAESLRPYINFATRTLDVLIAWQGGITSKNITSANPQELASITEDPRGGLVVVSHLGNVDISRAVLDKKTRDRLTILVHTRHAENYNRIIRRFNPDATTRLIQVTEIGPDTIINLKQRVENGEWIVIAGDRVSVLSRDQSVAVPFFGKNAAFPQGPWIMGALLECPVYLLFCMQDGQGYNLTMERFAETIDLPRATRAEGVRHYVARYAARLEHYAMQDPFQWYNFFDFWADNT